MRAADVTILQVMLVAVGVRTEAQPRPDVILP
jgi:hypothetical protein